MPGVNAASTIRPPSYSAAQANDHRIVEPPLSTRDKGMPLDLDVARKLVIPIYDALTRPGDKDVEALIKSVTSADFQSCGNEGECVDQAAAIARFKGLASVVLISIGRSRSFSLQARTRSSCVVRQPAHRSRPF